MHHLFPNNEEAADWLVWGGLIVDSRRCIADVAEASRKEEGDADLCRAIAGDENGGLEVNGMDISEMVDAHEDPPLCLHMLLLLLLLSAPVALLLFPPPPPPSSSSSSPSPSSFSSSSFRHPPSSSTPPACGAAVRRQRVVAVGALWPGRRGWGRIPTPCHHSALPSTGEAGREAEESRNSKRPG